jgi:hypothetical protein
MAAAPSLSPPPLVRTSCTTNESQMGLSFGLEDNTLSPKRKFRWLLKIPGISGQNDGAINALPPRKSARPSLSFKEIEVQHLSETVYYPIKPEWKTLNLVLYDIRCNENIIFEWVRMIYNPDTSGQRIWNPSVNGFPTILSSPFKKTAILELYDGCGNILEQWIYENAWPQTIDWGDLDMDSQDIVTVDVTLRYDRAYFVATNLGGNNCGCGGSATTNRRPIMPGTPGSGRPGTPPGTPPGQPPGSPPGTPPPLNIDQTQTQTFQYFDTKSPTPPPGASIFTTGGSTPPPGASMFTGG